MMKQGAIGVDGMSLVFQNQSGDIYSLDGSGRTVTGPQTPDLDPNEIVIGGTTLYYGTETGETVACPSTSVANGLLSLNPNEIVIAEGINTPPVEDGLLYKANSSLYLVTDFIVS